MPRSQSHSAGSVRSLLRCYGRAQPDQGFARSARRCATLTWLPRARWWAITERTEGRGSNDSPISDRDPRATLFERGTVSTPCRPTSLFESRIDHRYPTWNEPFMMLNGSPDGSDRATHDTQRDARALEEVMFVKDLVALLRVSRSTIERRRREGAFPIPELDPLDRRPRWSRRAVEGYLASGARPMLIRRGRPRSRMGR